MKSKFNPDLKSAAIREICGRLQIAFILCISHCDAFSIAVGADSPFVGSQSCNSVSCHGRTEPRRVLGVVNGASLQEYVHFERHDPHAKAAKTLASWEFQAILNKLSERTDGPTRAAVYRQCAQCHDPEGMAAEGGERVAISRGISCESCHGGAKSWLASHYQHDVSRASLIAAGMRDTKNLHVRGGLCGSCHVGSGAGSVNHDMLAAGHPPLRFELAAYHRKLTSHDAAGRQSHWNDARERIATQDFEVKLWEAGQFASAIAALAVLENRSHQAAQAAAEGNSSGASWPEFAEYDCFSCHQKLRPAAGNRQANAAGLPEWGTWNLGLVTKSTPAKGLNTLRAEMNKSFAFPPATVEAQAANARRMLLSSLLGEQATSNQLLQMLEQPSAGSKSWDALCQRYLAQRVIEKSISDEFQKRELAGGATVTERNGFDKQRAELDRDLAFLGRQLSFADANKEWPRVLATPQGIEQMESDLTAAAGKLRMLQSYLEPRR